MISVTVVSVPEPRRWEIDRLSLAEGTTVGGALAASRLGAALRETEGEPLVGIFGEAVDLDHVLREGDQLELHLPLTRDPKDQRRLRASRG
jgi:putative ubiquitin-RnfH superfamily antitoxin RatB of RatAB toxin-antitoxin module